MTLAFRPALLPRDAELLADLFTASVMELGQDYYDEEELEAWASSAEDVEAFGAALAPMLTLFAMKDGEEAGFVTLKDNAHIHMLYVSPDHAGQGVGKALVQAAETMAKHRGATGLTVDASDMAKHLFETLGYAPQRRNSVNVAGVWLANTTMSKQLAEPQGGRA